ncbi:MAG: alpha/beta fold hydrolase [Fidelibacterota bacterium]|nr:MAG: alpha/beta fold hydrolase [Candidatus Neomarinimicrobiota bacterium]
MTDVISGRFSSQEINLGDGPTGCFLIHGFSGSTYELQGLAEFLAGNGFRVTAKLLAGHGTSIEECNLVRADDWLREMEFHFTEFFLNCDTAFVIGLSMGASLALHLSTLFPVAGIVAMAPALILKNPMLRWYLPLAAPFSKSLPKKRVCAGNTDRQDCHYGYNGYPLNGLAAMLKLNRHIRSELHRVTSPTLVMHSRDDMTVPFDNATLLINSISSKDKALITYDHSGHVLADGPEKEKVWIDTLDFLSGHSPV